MAASSGKPEVPGPPQLPKQDSGETENSLTAIGDLESRSRINDFRRSEEVRDALQPHKAWIATTFIWLAATLILVVLIIVGWHYMAPAQWQWLQPDQVRNIERITLFSSLSLLVSQFIRKAF